VRFLKKILKILIVLILLILSTICIIIVDKDAKNNVSYAVQSNSSDIQLMARAINGEARGEPYEGQVAVGAVILNRVKDSRFPNSISGVIYQAGAFTAVADGQINVAISEGSTVYKAAEDAMNGWDPTGGCVYYFNPDTATNKWIWSRPLVKTIGKHRFCK
jgi:N-acetylmuramoyl-L-alanine amidase